MSAYQYPMERVLGNLHNKLGRMALQRTTARGRRLLERLLLFIFVAGFGVTMLVHVCFVHRDTTSLDGRPLQSIPLRCLSSVKGFSATADVTHLSLIDGAKGSGGDIRGVTRKSWTFRTPPSTSGSSSTEETTSCQLDEADGIPPYSLEDASKTYFSYSPVQGYLFLTQEKCVQHNISVQHVVISKTDENCFGESFLQKLVFYVVGPDTVMANWLLGAYNATGYIYNPRSKHLFDLSMYSNLQNSRYPEESHSLIQPQQWYHNLLSKLAVVLKTSFLFFIVTTLVSFILRETQERMLEFTYQLQRRVRSHRPVVHLVTTHVVENLVFVPIMLGLIFFLIECYPHGDKVAAFMVLSIVWVCEAFSVVSLRSSEGMHFFPRIFFLEFSMFHFYLFMFPFGFVYVALASTACCMVHTMLFFWHRYELPAVALSQVTPEVPVGEATGDQSVTPVRSNSRGQLATRAPVPAARLPPRPITRQHSTSTSSSQGRVHSRFSSSSALFHAGDDDGDESSSYMYFMDGEVVMHQPHRRLSNGTADSSVDGEVEIAASVSMQSAPHESDPADPLLGAEVAAVHNVSEVNVAQDQTPRADNRVQEWVRAGETSAPGIPTLGS